jgi:DHA2 family multidrug resistance protein-like MFS transporter
MTYIGARRWWALAALMASVLVVGLDGTILSVALPTLAGALHATESDLQWFSSGYLVTLAAAMLPAGLMGDRWGRKKVLLVALGVFGLGSAACAFAPSAGAFIAARMVLGAAGAGIVVMAVSALTVLFSKEERPKAVGMWAAANFLALPIGPILGGWLLSNFWWGWVFLLNVPVALLGLLVALALVPESRSPEKAGLDPVGIVASSAGLVALTYGLIDAGQNGWTDAIAVGWMAAGAVLLVGFFLWERRLTRLPGGRPLVDLALFRSASFTWGVILAAVCGLAMIGVLFTMPQFFQSVVGTDAMGSGLRLLPLIAGLIVGAVPADRVARLAGRKIAVALGFAVLAAGLGIGAMTAPGSSDAYVAIWMTVVGAGTGLAMATAASSALSELSVERSGVGSAVMQAFQKVGAPFGAAILGSVLNAAYRSSLDVTGLPAAAAAVAKGSVFAGEAVAHQLRSVTFVESVRNAFVHGIDVALLVSAGIAAAGIVLTLAFLPGKAAEQRAEQVEREQPVAAAR